MILEDLDLHDREPGDSAPTYVPEQGSLKSLNIDEELYMTYAKAKNFLVDVQMGDETPANQVAQVFNTISGILKEIVKMQTELYSAERVKKLEAAMITALKLVPEEAQESFFTEYEKLLKDQ